MERNRGYRQPTPDPESYIFGSGNVKGEILQPDGDWRDFLPANEIQNINNVETFGCSGFGTSNAIEAYMKRKFGGDYNYSDRAIGIIAGTTEQGNDPQTVCEAIRNKGLIPEADLPFTDAIHSTEEFYSPKPLPKLLKDEGDGWLEAYSFQHDWVNKPGRLINHHVLAEALKYSPIAIAVNAWEMGSNDEYIRIGDDNHWCVLVAFEGGNPIVFDSYEERGSELKKLSPDYDFYTAKRIFISRPGKKKFFTTLISIFRDFWAFVFKPRY